MSFNRIVIKQGGGSQGEVRSKDSEVGKIVSSRRKSSLPKLKCRSRIKGERDDFIRIPDQDMLLVINLFGMAMNLGRDTLGLEESGKALLIASLP